VPTATQERVRIFFEAVVRNLFRFAREFGSRRLGESVDYHQVE
jgi:hypothetical protein